MLFLRNEFSKIVEELFTIIFMIKLKNNLNKMGLFNPSDSLEVKLSKKATKVFLLFPRNSDQSASDLNLESDLIIFA